MFDKLQVAMTEVSKFSEHEGYFYNMLSYVNYKKFNAEFEKWILEIFNNDLDGKTIAIDGKSICSTTCCERQ